MINIELTEDQVKVLSFVLSLCAGDPKYSGRRITDEISEKIWDCRMGYDSFTEIKFPIIGANDGTAQLYFESTK